MRQNPQMREHYLDGLRGWAALCVVFCHVGPYFFNLGPRFAGLVPFVTDGTFAVYVFFVLSGYVLSIDFFKARKRRIVVDLALRRYPRLTLPILVSVLAAALLGWGGLMFNLRVAELMGNDAMRVLYAAPPSFAQSVQFSLWGVYLSPGALNYNPVLWTMYYEMLGSLILFAFLVTAGRSSALTLAGHATFICVAWNAKSPIVAIAMGAVIANATQFQWHARLMAMRGVSIVAGLLLLLALLCAAMRQDIGDSRLLALCSTGVVYAVLLAPCLRSALSSSLSRSLGELSFPLYLVHVPLMCSLMSYGYVRAVDSGFASPWVFGAIAAAGVALSLLAAIAFRPVEQLAIAAGRSLSRALMGAAAALRTSRG